MDNIVIDRPERLEEDITDFKIDAVEAEKNFTTARLRVCRNPETDSPIIFYSQELNRNFQESIGSVWKTIFIEDVLVFQCDGFCGCCFGTQIQRHNPGA